MDWLNDRRYGLSITCFISYKKYLFYVADSLYNAFVMAKQGYRPILCFLQALAAVTACDHTSNMGQLVIRGDSGLTQNQSLDASMNALEPDAMNISQDAMTGVDAADAGHQSSAGQFGDSCRDQSDCETGICLQSGYALELGLICSQACTDLSDCPNNWYCRVKGEQRDICIFGVTSREMAEKPTLTIMSQGNFQSGDIPEASLRAEQLIMGLRRDGWQVDTIEDALNRTDDGVRFLDIIHRPSGNKYTQLKLYMGDTEVGYLYVEASLIMVAYIGDGDINDCTAFEAVDLLRDEGQEPSASYCFPM